MATLASRLSDEQGTRAMDPDDVESPTITTLLQLVQTVQEETESDEEAVEVISHLLASGRVVLCGIFAGVPLRFSDLERSDRDEAPSRRRCRRDRRSYNRSRN